MFHICFAADENYIKYTAVLIASIVKSTDTSREFKDFFDGGSGANAHTLATRERERESKNGADTQNLANQTPNSQSLNFTNSAQNSQTSVNLATQTAQNSTNQNENSQFSTPTPKNSLENYKKLDYNSLSDDEKSEGYVFHILTDKITENSRKKLENLAQTLAEIYPCEIEIHTCDDSIFQNFPKFKDNYLAYFRFLIPNFMPRNLKMCLYLDTDMLVLGDLRGLFALNLDGQYAGVVSLHEHRFGIYARNFKDENFYFENFYFNSGFLLFNLAEWKKNDLRGKVFDFMRRYEVANEPDQYALNGVIRKENALILPCEYNLLICMYCPNGTIWHRNQVINHIPYTKEQITFAYQNPMVWHFVGGTKPWNGLFSGVDGRGKIIEMNWWEVAWETPYFSDELKPLFVAKCDNYLVCKDFGLFVGSLIDVHLRSVAGFLKMPFAVYKAFKEFDLSKCEFYAAKVADKMQLRQNTQGVDKNVAFEFYYLAVKAWCKRHKRTKVLKIAALPFHALRTKRDCEKGYFVAHEKSAFHKLYAQKPISRQEYYLKHKTFGLYIGSLIDTHLRGFVGFFKMPFAVYKAFASFDVSKMDFYASHINANLDKNVAFEFYYLAVKAWCRRKWNAKLEQFISLSYKAFRAKLHYKRGDFGHNKESEYYKFYVE